MSDDMATTAKIDGVARSQLAWVRVTGGQDVAKGADGAVTLSGWKPEDALKALGDWAKSDGLDTRNAAPNFRNSVHGALNHHVADHSLGSWGEKSVVVVAPLDRMMEANGKPATLNTVDTYWTLDANKSLQLPGATVVRPDEGGQLGPSETSRRLDASSVVYASTFNDEREKQLLQQLAPHDRSNLAQRLNGAVGRDGYGEEGTLSMPRAERPAGLSAAVDAELTQISKREATHGAVAEIGPVRMGNNYSWQGSNIADDTERMAKALGTKADVHTGSSEDKAVDLMRAGRAADVSALPGIGQQTKDLATSLVSDARYEAFAQAKRVDRELSEAVVSPSITLSTPARERLASMVERSAEGLASPPIQATDQFGKLSGKTYAVTSSDTPAGQALPDSRLDDAVKQNTRLSTLVRNAVRDEGDPALSARLSAALDHLSSSNTALGARSAAPRDTTAAQASQAAPAVAAPATAKSVGGAAVQDKSAAYWANVVARAPQRSDKLAAAAEKSSMAHRAMRA